MPNNENRSHSPVYAIAGIRSPDLENKVQKTWHQFENGVHPELNITEEVFHQRTVLAQLYALNIRELTEMTLGSDYYADPRTRLHLLSIVERVIFSSEDDELRATAKKLNSMMPR